MNVMIAIAAVATIGAVSLPMYQRHQIKTEINQVYQDIFETNVKIDRLLAAGVQPTLSQQEDGQMIAGHHHAYVPLAYLNSSPLVDKVELSMNEQHQFQGLNVTLGKQADVGVRNAVIQFQRQGDGNWHCQVDASQASGWHSSYIASLCGTK